MPADEITTPRAERERKPRSKRGERRTRGPSKGYQVRKRGKRFTVIIRKKGYNNDKPQYIPLPLHIDRDKANLMAQDEYKKIFHKKVPGYAEEEKNKKTLKGLIQEYIDDCEKSKKSNSGLLGGFMKINLETFPVEKKNLERFIDKNPVLVAKKLGEVESSDFQDYLIKRIDLDGKTVATALRELSPVFKILGKYAHKVRRLPAMYDLRKGVNFPEEENEPGNDLTPEQVQAIHQTLSPVRVITRPRDLLSEQWKLIFDWALENGVRMGGLRKITLPDLAGLYDQSKPPIYHQPKDKKSPPRNLPVSLHLASRIKAWVAKIPDQYRNDPKQTVFYTLRGKRKYKPLLPKSSCTRFSNDIVGGTMKRLRVQAEATQDENKKAKLLNLAQSLEPVTFHDTRHTAKTDMLFTRRMLPEERDYMCGVLKGKDRYIHIEAHIDDVGCIRDKLDPNWRMLLQRQQQGTPELEHEASLPDPDARSKAIARLERTKELRQKMSESIKPK